jgi:hypothetical protein
MIFGFNTDIKQADTVYHVQSEARKAEQLLQTQVFVRGRCIGKKATSYAAMAAKPEFTEDNMHEMLKSQHRSMIDGIREGKINELLGLKATETAVPGGLAIAWLNSDLVCANSSITMQFAVTEKGVAVSGAQLTARVNAGNEAPIYLQAMTDTDGRAEMKISLQQSALNDAVVLVQAKAGAGSVTRKFKLRKSA